MWEMWTDLLLQAILIISTLFIFLLAYNVPQNLFAKLRRRHGLRSLGDFQARRHFVKGAQLLGEARSSNNASLAKSAELEADKAIALDPTDAAAHLLKALALELQGFKTAAVDSLDSALERSLEEEERANALYKRAELRLQVSQNAVDSVVEDLVESVRLNGDNPKAFCLLGECYEKMGSIEKAKKAFEDALQIRPNFASAQNSLARLIASS